MTATTRPAPLQQLLDEIDAAERDARALVADLSDAQLNWQPQANRAWSIAQCLDHLRLINLVYLDGFAQAVERAGEGNPGTFERLRPGWLGRWFVRSLEPPPRLKATARPHFVPSSTVPTADALEGFVASHAPYRALVDACAHVDPNRITAPNPLFPMIRMTVATALLVIPAHDRRHLWQARQVREKMIER
jgi:hypothetical protein